MKDCRLCYSHSAAVLILTLVLAQACVSTDSRVDEHLDRQTGATITTAAEPLVFARTDARYSRSGRDYVYIGPVSLNRQGLRDYYLWVGLGTTIDRGYLAPERPLPSKLHLIVGSELMEFELSSWEQSIGTRRDSPAYKTAVAVKTDLVSRVTLDQIERLTSGTIQSIYVSDPAGQQIFSSWASGSWSEFLQREGAVPVAQESQIGDR